MRTSQIFFPTLKESPAEAEIASHKLMLRAGLIRKVAAGIYTWLPLGFKILNKVATIVREEMNKVGAQELMMPVVQPAEFWHETGRWEKYGPTLLKIKDRKQSEFCFGPTHEEVITDLVRNTLSSYKQLPLTLYQIQTKFRDEIRPRFGIMRTREFLMKDAYSFHTNQESLENTYQQTYQAYCKILERIGLNYRVVLADAGNIGGSQSHEFQVLAEAGEDILAYNDAGTYAANVERATCKAPAAIPADAELLAKSIKTTPGITSVAKQAENMNIPTNKILKTILVQGAHSAQPVVALLVRGDHQINYLKAAKLVEVATPLTLVSEVKVNEIAKCRPGFVGPVNLNIPIIADRDAAVMVNFSCGANQDDQHHFNINWQRDIPMPKIADIREIIAGDISPDGNGELKLTRGIEIGHIFQLGDKYSQDMEATVLDAAGNKQPLIMGCYGIGISRIVAAAIEQNHATGNSGIIWPKSLAPFQVAIVPIGANKSPEVKAATENLYQELIAAGIDVLLDDRSERPGVMFADMELIGIPHRLVIGSKILAKNMVEYKNNQATEPETIQRDQIINFIQEKLCT